MECNPRIPGQITPVPLFPDGRGELIDVLMPSEICRVESNFLDKLIRTTINKNKPKIDCKKPQKSNEIPEPSDEPPEPPPTPEIPDDTFGLWIFGDSSKYSYSFPGDIYAPENWWGSWSQNIIFDSSVQTVSGSTFTDSDYPDHTIVRATYREAIVTVTMTRIVTIVEGEEPKFDFQTTTYTENRTVHRFFVVTPNLSLLNFHKFTTVYEGQFGTTSGENARVFYGEYRPAYDSVNSGIFEPTDREGVTTSYSFVPIWSSAIDLTTPIRPTKTDINQGDNGMTNKDDCCCDCVEAVASVMEAYMEKIAPMFEDLKKYIDRRLVEETNETKKYLDTQLYKQSEFIQKQILELDDQQIDFTPVINQIKTTEQNLWTGSTLQINSEELPKEEKEDKQ
jgi:hypothetical protein